MRNADYEMEVVGMAKSELAEMYAPDLSPHAALNRLSRWIAYNPQLTEALRLTGYRKHARQLSPRQVELIFRYLGEP